MNRNWTSTQIAQMALSAIVRSGESIDFLTLIDVLTGNSTEQVCTSGFDKIKTFGVGNDYSAKEWVCFLLQMAELNLFFIDYKVGSILKVSKNGHDLLSGAKDIILIGVSDKLQVEGLPLEEQTSKLIERKLYALRGKYAKIWGCDPYKVLTAGQIKQLLEINPKTTSGIKQVLGKERSLDMGREILSIFRSVLLVGHQYK